MIPVLADSPNKGDDQTFQGAATGTITAVFSPNGSATKLVTDTIHQAKKQILVQAYSFTSPAIATDVHLSYLIKVLVARLMWNRSIILVYPQ